MTTTFKACPICEARNQRNAAICATCGARIAEIAPRQDRVEDDARRDAYDFRYGETDLAESSLAARGRVGSVLLLILIVAAGAILALIALGPRIRLGLAANISPTDIVLPTRLAGPSVTPGQPTSTLMASALPTRAPTQMPTPAPCVRNVAEGDSLIAIVSRCGHTSLAILPTVMALNGITDETRVQIGQEIIVPVPTPASESNSNAVSTGSAAAASDDSQLTRLAFDPFAPTLTPTLLPGLKWHVVRADEDMIYLAAVYDTDVKMLSDLNPEIDFLLCDFGAVFGGPECTVQLSVNQHVRVPAPTATLVATSSGSDAPTALPTATFNAPIAQSPENEAYFSPFEQVTLRWVGTGRLDGSEAYRIDLTNVDSGERFQTDTRELFLILPGEWQSQDSESHRYSWQVSVANTVTNKISFATELRSFIWQGREQA